MDFLPRSYRTLVALLRPDLGRRLLQALLLSSGVALIVVAAAFLVTDRPGEGARPSAAASGLQPDTDATLDVGPALGQVEPNALYGSLVRFAQALRPTATPAPKPAPALVPAAQPAAPAAPVLPAGEPEPTSPPPASGPDCPTASMSGYGRALFDAVNNERRQAGMAALAAHGCVVYVAQLRSEDMASRNYFSHSSPDGATAFSIMDGFGVPYGWAGENLARNNYPDAETVAVAIRDLMASPAHRDNILSGNYTHLGIGYADDGAGMRYYTMVFIGPA